MSTSDLLPISGVSINVVIVPNRVAQPSNTSECRALRLLDFIKRLSTNKLLKETDLDILSTPTINRLF